ncbi:MAG TPA: hypothetical protein DCL74_00625 [Succinivibrionaceae bacterium]|nr:hypothetical protein [Succinivibrionaceae bacterium]
MSKKLLTAAVAAFFFTGCSSQPPANSNNLCSVFQDKDGWYVAAHKVHAKYGIPIDTAMAILAQNSKLSTQDNGLFDGLTSAVGLGNEGFLVVSDEIWQQYKDEAGTFLSDRGSFADALDFMGWYMNKAKERSGVALCDAYNQYIVYREGFEAFNARTYTAKDWLLKEASEVRTRASEYRQQLLRCNLY